MCAGIPGTSLYHLSSSQFVSAPRRTFSPALLLPLLLEDLLSAGSGDVQESPGCVGVQLLLVTTQGPNVHHPQHLLLRRGEESRGSGPKRQYRGRRRALLDLISDFLTRAVHNQNLVDRLYAIAWYHYDTIITSVFVAWCKTSRMILLHQTCES